EISHNNSFHAKFYFRQNFVSRKFFNAKIYFTQNFISRKAPPMAASQRGKGRREILFLKENFAKGKRETLCSPARSA
ncbi:MAG: hypothetical protein ACXWV5_08045, partial [Flavitalea sp.]